MSPLFLHDGQARTLVRRVAGEREVAVRDQAVLRTDDGDGGCHGIKGKRDIEERHIPGLVCGLEMFRVRSIGRVVHGQR